MEKKSSEREIESLPKKKKKKKKNIEKLQPEERLGKKH